MGGFDTWHWLVIGVISWLLFGGSLDLNRASSEALQVLPGIGPSRASAILETRSARPFENVADLARVHGIGPKTIEGLKGWVAVERIQ